MGPESGTGKPQGVAAVGLLPQCLHTITSAGQTSTQVGETVCVPHSVWGFLLYNSLMSSNWYNVLLHSLPISSMQVCVRPWSRDVSLTVPTQAANLSAAPGSSCPALSPHWAGVDHDPEEGHCGAGCSHIQWCDWLMECFLCKPRCSSEISTSIMYFFSLRWNVAKWSWVMDHRRAAGLLASSLQVPLFTCNLQFTHFRCRTKLVHDCLCVGMS